jgi:hypothetical protein
MNRAALEHVLRAASDIANERDFIVIGSQSVLGQFPNAPDALLDSLSLPQDRLEALRKRLAFVCRRPPRADARQAPSRQGRLIACAVCTEA